MADNKRYKRSWRNYLLDSNYQLRFTFTMIAVAAGLMAPLGWWVSQKATTATEVALNQIDGIQCPEVLSAAPPVVSPSPGGATGEPAETTDLLDETEPALPESEAAPEAPADPAAGTVAEPAPVDPEAVEPEADESDPEVADDSSPEGEDTGDAPRDRSRTRAEIKVEILDSDMPEAVVVVGEIEKAPPTPEEIAASQAANTACLADVAGRKSSVRDRERLITTVMLVSGFFLLLGLGFYGIKTTHRVAGPLFKVGLYLGKLENNVYDTVYNLRKGDQLVEFYEHFKGAHKGLTTMQQEDRDQLRDAIALAKDAGLVDKNDEMKAIVSELERLLEEKEKSLGKKQA